MVKRLTKLPRTTMVRNILAVYDQATEGEREYGEAWYRVAHDAAARIGRTTGFTTRRVAAVISALSPSNVWQRNLIDAEAFCKAARDGARTRPSASTYGPNADKAWALLTAEDFEDELEYFEGRAHKTRAFFLSIADPGANHGTVVVDGHAWNIAHATTQPIQSIGGLSAKGRYYPVAEAYCAAAVLAGITPQAMQATCWLVWRRTVDLDQQDLFFTTERI